MITLGEPSNFLLNYCNIKVVILIVSHNAESWISYFTSELGNLPEKWKVFIVDNASSDNTCEIIESKFPNFILHKSPTNLGFGAANNIGLSYCLMENVEHVLLLNQDAKITMHDIAHLLYVQRENPDYYIVSPIHLNGSGLDLDHGFSTYCAPTYCPGLYSDALLHRSKEVYSSKYGNAAAWLLSAECLKVIGGFNPLFFHYGEDDEFRHRVFFHGKKLGIAPASFAYHARENRLNTRKIPNELFVEMLIRMLDINKNFNIKSALYFCVKAILKSLLKLRIKEAFGILFQLFILISKNDEIINSKKITAKKGSTFLSMDPL